MIFSSINFSGDFRCFIIFLSFLLFFSSCAKDDLVEVDIDIAKDKIGKKYLHISHTRKSVNPEIDDVAANIDYSLFDMLFLGGDLAHLTSADASTMGSIDAIFDFGNPNTLWTMGNHDYSDLSLLTSFTHRPTYYSYTNNGICFLVLDTQDSMSNIIGAQKELFNKVVDTIQSCSHLVILHHKLIQIYGNPVLEPLEWTIPNANIGQISWQINPNNFYTDLYPKLEIVEQRGVEVICVAGDLGFKATEFEYETPEGIHFLGSGINAGASGNKALLFFHNEEERTLSWEFRLLTEFQTR
jgi:hypothetical protein